MRQTGLPGVIVVLIGAAMLTAAGAVAAYEEFSAFATGSQGSADRFAALQHGAYRAGPSHLAKQLVLDACLEGLRGVYGRMQPRASRAAVATNCVDQADAIAAEVPSFAYAYYVGALASAELGDVAGFNSRLLISQMTGPTEQWLAELRVDLAEDNFTALAPDVLSRHEADLRLLVVSGRGIASISNRYVRQPEFRARIAAIVESLSEEDQVRFVDRVRAAAARGRS